MSNEVDIWYIRVPLVAGLDNKLKPNAKLLLGEIVNLAEVKGYAFARNKHYMKRLAITEATVINAMANLEEEGYIRRWFDHSKKNNTVRRIYVNYDKLIELTEEYRQSLNDQPAVNDEAETPITFAESSQVEQVDYKSFEETIKPIVSDYKEYSQTPQKLGSETINSGGHKKVFKNSINISPNNELEDGHKHENSPSQQKSEEAAELSSKDNRPIGLSLPNVNDDSLSKEISQSVSSKPKPKTTYDYSFNVREYLASKASSGFKRTASLYPNKNNLEDAAGYYATVVSGELIMSSLREAVEQLPQDEPREFLEYLEFMVEQKRTNSLRDLQISPLRTE